MSYKPEIKGYLLFDHGGVLDGTPADPSNPIKYNKASDLVTVANKLSMSFLPNGIAILNMLYELELNGYKILYASSNKEEDQLAIKNTIEKDASKKNVNYPSIYAMPVLDKTQFNTATLEEPEVIRDREHGIIVVGIGSDNDLSGKAFLRRALENAGIIDSKLIKNSIVFDDGPIVVRQAQREGYQAYRVGETLAENDYGEGPEIPGGDLYTGVKAFYEQAKLQSKSWIDSKEQLEVSEQSGQSENEHRSDNFPFNPVFSSRDTKSLLKYMKWKAWPHLFKRTAAASWFRIEVTRYTKNLQIEALIKDEEINRTLFNLAVYRSVMPKNEKQKNLDTFLKSLSGKSLEESDVLIDAALADQKLTKNTGLGFYRFFHSLPHGIHNTQMDNRFARSTTEELLIDLRAAVKGAVKNNALLEGRDNSSQISA